MPARTIPTQSLHRSRASATPTASIGSFRGITLIETLIAMALLSGSALLASSLFTLAANAARDARWRTMSAALAMQKMEQLQSLEWSVDAGGMMLTDDQTDLSIDPHGLGGPGLETSPADALDVNAPGYVDYLNARGDSIGGGATPVPGTAFVRRWSVTASPLDPQRSLVLQVRVDPFIGGIAEAWRSGRPIGAWLATIRTRTRR